MERIAAVPKVFACGRTDHKTWLTRAVARHSYHKIDSLIPRLLLRVQNLGSSPQTAQRKRPMTGERERCVDMTDRVFKKPHGTAAEGAPIGLLLVFLVVMICIQFLSPRDIWAPLQSNTDARYDVSIGTDIWELQLDTKNIPQAHTRSILELLPGQPKALSGTMLPTWSNAAAEEIFQGAPRAYFKIEQAEATLEGKLFALQAAPGLYGGPIRVRLESAFLAPHQSKGVSLDILGDLPQNSSQVLVIDSGILRLPEDLKKKLVSQWKRWEFNPLLDLAPALKGPFCFLKWEGTTILASQMDKPEMIDRFIDYRFPTSLVARTARWSHGVRVHGFQEDSRAAWYQRGDYFFCTPDGGIDSLSHLLERRFDVDQSLRDGSPFLKELSALVQAQKGWHVCIIERSQDRPIHWALLLKWPEPDSDLAEGFLMTQLLSKHNLKQRFP